MKEPFKIGDRVRIFDMCEVTHSVTEDKGKVLEMLGDRLLVKCDTWKNSDSYGIGNYFHKKQCRRLRPKKKRVKKTLYIGVGEYIDQGCYSVSNACLTNLFEKSGYKHGVHKIEIEVEE